MLDKVQELEDIIADQRKFIIETQEFVADQGKKIAAFEQENKKLNERFDELYLLAKLMKECIFDNQRWLMALHQNDLEGADKINKKIKKAEQIIVNATRNWK